MSIYLSIYYYLFSIYLTGFTAHSAAFRRRNNPTDFSFHPQRPSPVVIIKLQIAFSVQFLFLNGDLLGLHCYIFFVHDFGVWY